MAYLGRYRQGDFVPLLVQCKNSSGTPTVPNDSPQAKVYDPSGNFVVSFLVPVADRYSLAGLFQHFIRLGVAYAALGNYRVVYHYGVGSPPFHGIDEDTFEVVAGGHQDGTVISLYAWNRPYANFVIQELDSGKIVFSRNPRLA